MPGFEIFGEEERRQVQDVLDTGVLFRYGFDAARKGHWKARTFESEFAARLGTKHCHLCSSGSAALSIALAAAGIGYGDEVVVPPFTFVATVEAVLLAGAVPVFAEIDETLCLDPGAVAQVLTPRTRAVVAVHMCGSMARIDELAELCRRQGLVLIEDACQAVGGTFQGRALGTFGQMGCFSFDSVKTITCGEGGAVVTDDADLYRLAHQYADHGHDHAQADRGAEDHPILGMNARISELNAAVGLAQLRKLDEILARQREAKQVLKDALSACPAVQWRWLPDPAGDSATFLSFLLPDEERARRAAADLAAAGVDGCFYWYDNNWHYLRRWEHFKRLKSPARMPQTGLPEFAGLAQVQVPVSDKIIGRTISMQIKLSWSDADIAGRGERMAAVLAKI
ncbi:MAG TPA: DegT/DnrJ/EryC1/StrS family aminotransferase [Desulfobacteraceae bacterium]|nr:DegT/DnrJ/EryC1/StrS family aminotransferase [Deltaproteobacteria bacterium]HDI58749.1 DegT/DnrJ/EryC1/StrS family aminotransferase [Desulfobacteraceae bacterium]